MQHTLNKDLAVAIGFCKDRNATAFLIENALRRAKKENEADHAPFQSDKKVAVKNSMLLTATGKCRLGSRHF